MQRIRIFLKILKKYKIVISAFGIALAIYMGAYDVTDKPTAYLLVFVFVLLPLVLNKDKE
jgi:hypothetical protein